MDICGVIITFDGITGKRTETIVKRELPNKALFNLIVSPSSINDDYIRLINLAQSYLTGSKRYVIHGADENGRKVRKIWEPHVSLSEFERYREENLINKGLYVRPVIQ